MHIFSKSLIRLLYLCCAIISAPIWALNSFVCNDTQGNPLYFDWGHSSGTYKDYKKEFIAFAKKHICNEDLSVFGLRCLVAYLPDDMGSIVDAVINHVNNGTISVKTLDNIYDGFRAFPVHINRIKEEVEKKWTCPVAATHIDIFDILNGSKLIQNKKNQIPKILDCKKNYIFTCTQNQGTQTECHVQKYVASVISLVLQYNIIHQKPAVKRMLMQAFNQEIKEFKKGNYVFWHGRQYAWDYWAYIYKQLYNLFQPKHKKVADDYVFLRFDNSKSVWANDAKNDGLYLNAYLFGNIFCEGHSTIQLILKHYDWSNGTLNAFSEKLFFETFNMQKWYKKYQADFEKLKELHQAANTNDVGNLLLVSIDENNINRVYSAGDWTDVTVPISLSNGQKTTELKKIIQDLRAGKLTDFDHLQCVLPLTKEYALDPEKGFKVYSFTACEEQKRKEFEEFGAQLFAKIATDLTSTGIIN